MTIFMANLPQDFKRLLEARQIINVDCVDFRRDAFCLGIFIEKLFATSYAGKAKVDVDATARIIWLVVNLEIIKVVCPEPKEQLSCLNGQAGVHLAILRKDAKPKLWVIG